MPFSRSRSIESNTRSATSWLARKAPDCQSIASTSVVLPWSTWATIARFLRSSRVAIGAGVYAAASASRARRLPRRPDPRGLRRAVRRRRRRQLVRADAAVLRAARRQRPAHGGRRAADVGRGAAAVHRGARPHRPARAGRGAGPPLQRMAAAARRLERELAAIDDPPASVLELSRASRRVANAVRDLRTGIAGNRTAAAQ